jgi:hypothetical protein
MAADGGHPAGDSHIASALRVHSEGEVGVVFAVVHSGKGGGVDHNIELSTVKGSLQEGEVGDVDFGQIHRNHLMVRLEVGREVTTQHPLASCNQDSHGVL